MNTRILLILSLVLNLALAAVLLLGRKPADRLTAVPVAPAAASKPAGPAAIETVVSNAFIQKFDWRAVESDDYKKYIANLRSVGCPEETIRDIIIADVNKLFEDRKKALRKKPAEKFKFWETGMSSMTRMMGGAMDEEFIKQSQALAAEKRALLKELLGVDVDEKPDLMAGMNPFESMLDFLPSDKQTKVMELMQQFQARMMKEMGDGGDGLDGQKMLAAQKQMEAELAQVLSPAEMEDYQLRLSQTAMMMRMNMDGFEPTEQEFRDVFKLQKGFDDQYSAFSMGDEDKDARTKRETAQKELDDKIKASLGDSRYADYQREKDYEYKNIAKALKREGLDKQVGVKVYDMRKVALDEANKLRADKSLTAEDRDARLKLIRSETESAMISVMGQKGYDAYKKNANNWLNRISRLN